MGRTFSSEKRETEEDVKQKDIGIQLYLWQYCACYIHVSNHIELELNSWSEIEKVASGRKNKTLKNDGKWDNKVHQTAVKIKFPVLCSLSLH